MWTGPESICFAPPALPVMRLQIMEKASLREIVSDFLAVRVNKDRALYTVWFPPGVRVSILQDEHSWRHGNGDKLYITFTPDNHLSTYKLAAKQFYENTRLVVPSENTGKTKRTKVYPVDPVRETEGPVSEKDAGTWPTVSSG